MSKISIKIKNTEGKEVTVKLEAASPLEKRFKDGYAYRLGDLVSLASTGKLSDKETEKSPALVGMTQDKALEMVEDLYRAGSESLKAV
jgi:hypothetical protein